jgi:hypothetical protein
MALTPAGNTQQSLRQGPGITEAKRQNRKVTLTGTNDSLAAGALKTTDFTVTSSSASSTTTAGLPPRGPSPALELDSSSTTQPGTLHTPTMLSFGNTAAADRRRGSLAKLDHAKNKGETFAEVATVQKFNTYVNYLVSLPTNTPEDPKKHEPLETLLPAFIQIAEKVINSAKNPNDLSEILAPCLLIKTIDSTKDPLVLTILTDIRQELAGVEEDAHRKLSSITQQAQLQKKTDALVQSFTDKSVLEMSVPEQKALALQIANMHASIPDFFNILSDYVADYISGIGQINTAFRNRNEFTESLVLTISDQIFGDFKSNPYKNWLGQLTQSSPDNEAIFKQITLDGIHSNPSFVNNLKELLNAVDEGVKKAYQGKPDAEVQEARDNTQYCLLALSGFLSIKTFPETTNLTLGQILGSLSKGAAKNPFYGEIINKLYPAVSDQAASQATGTISGKAEDASSTAKLQ